MKPPTPLRRVESSSNNSLSSMNSGPNDHFQNSNQSPQLSPRLVDYFVVFCSKPKPRKKIESKEKSARFENEEDGDISKRNKSPRSGFCCKKKSKLESSVESNQCNVQNSNEKPASESKRHSQRSIHLSDNMEQLHMPKSPLPPLPPSRKKNDYDEDKTPITRHHRRKKIKKKTGADHDGDDDDDDNDNDHIISPSDEETNKSSSMIISESTFRVPVTNDSFMSDNESDIDTDDDYEEMRKTTDTITIDKKRDDHQGGNSDVGGYETEDEVVTPSRMRASQGLHLDDSDDDEYADKTQDDNKHRNKNSNIKEEGIREHRGASENIHLPLQDGNGNDDSSNRVTLTPVETARYPPKDHADCPFNPMTSHFCFPRGHTIHFTTEYVMPRIHYFVLTNDRGKKMYGTCLTVYEEFEIEKQHDLTEEDLNHFCIKEDVWLGQTDSESSIEVSLDYSEKLPTLYHPKVICILSSWPYLHAFREYLSQLYRLATLTNLMKCPLERYVINICEEVPAPPPGMFEIRLKILNSNIRFWAPPANQPIPYVSIPFNILFECLDLNNILFVWYALTLEHKILLVSSQSTLLTLCAEILGSLLFPMEWTHLYIPVLPIFLSQVLDAPFPYLCGITRDNLQQAIENISEETIVVDLDQNLITMGENTPPFPPMPFRRRMKLESCLQKTVGNVFWLARGVTKQEVEAFQNGSSSSNNAQKNPLDMTKTVKIWKEKLKSYDDAFNLAFTPDSENSLNEERKSLGIDDFEQTQWDIVQEAFLSFFSTMLRDYKRFISKTGTTKTFRVKEFLKAQRPDFKPFLKEFTATQQFDVYITKAMFSPKEPDLIFFDQSIAAKKNRSRMTLKKKKTPFLQSAKAQKQLQVVEAAKPAVENESGFNLLDNFYANSSDNKKVIYYPKWPELFDANLLKNPKKIPDIIAAEYVKRLGSKVHDEDLIDLHDFHVTEANYSIEVTTFTLFFILCCELMGKELESVQKKYFTQEDRFISEITLPTTKKGFTECSNICTFGQTASSATVDAEYKASNRNRAVNLIKNDNLSTITSEVVDSEVETARMVAFAELDLAFSALDTMFMRNLKPNVDALKSLMAACGRIECSSRAEKLMKVIQDNGVHVDSETYYYFCMNAPLDGQKYRKDWSGVKMQALKRKKANRRKKADEYLEGSDNSSYSGTGSSFHDTLSINSSSIGQSRLPPRPKSAIRKKKKVPDIKNLSTTEQVERHIVIGDSLLTYLYSDLDIDTNCSTCQSCGTLLKEDQIRLGWNFCSFSDKTTECPHCKNNFVPSFVVKTSDANFIGSQGPRTPLFCDFLSPWVLHKEIYAATQDNSMKNIMDPKWRNGGDRNSVIWWNLIVSLQRNNLPITFLLQGSFNERLIMPMRN